MIRAPNAADEGTGGAAASSRLPWPAGSTPLRAWITVVVLTLAFILSFIDRLVLAVLLEPLKLDLQLTDVQLALLHGTAFAVFYSIVGLPLAWLADRWSRQRIIVLGMLLWSATTVLAGYSRSFPQLFICRMGVGLGEAALTPAAHSIFAELFPRDRLSRAIGVYMTGGILGSGIALLLGGMLLRYFEAQPEAFEWALAGLVAWQKTLVSVGVPGLLLAILVYAVVRDPRTERALRAADAASKPGDTSLWQHIRRNPRPYAAVLLGYMFVAVYSFSFFTWTASFLVRRYELAPADAGALFGILMLTAGVVGPTASGMFSDRMRARGHALAPL
ncbi:MAG: MFS transporter, partial [Steroidobacteraceae bacterium]